MLLMVTVRVTPFNNQDTLTVTVFVLLTGTLFSTVHCREKIVPTVSGPPDTMAS